MGTKNSGLLALLFLILALALTVPLPSLLSHSGSLALPSLSSNDVAIAATAGLFIIPVIFMFLAILILAGKTKRSRPARVRYPWEHTFPDVVKEHELPGAEVSRARPAGQKVITPGAPLVSSFGIKAFFVVVIVILLLVGLAFLNQTLSKPFDSGSNVAKANTSMEKKAEQQQEKAKNNASPNSSAVPSIEAPAKNSGVKLAVWFRSLAASFANSVQEMPAKVWQLIAAGALVVLLAQALFYSSKAGQLSEAGEWFGGIVGWLAAFPAVIRADFARIIMPAIVLAVVAFIAVGYFFRKWLGANLPGFALVANNLVSFLSMARDFFLVYKIYILVGIFALIAVVGFLMTAERRGNGSKQQEADLEKQLNNSAPVTGKNAGSK